MDISLHKFKHLLFLALLALPILGNAQVGLTQEKTAFRNTILKIWAQDAIGTGLVPVNQPENGQLVDIIRGGNNSNGVDTILYLPNPDFLGQDAFTFEHYTDGNPNIAGVVEVHTTVEIKIVPSYVEAQHDYTVTNQGEMALIRVVTNDSVTHGALTIDPIFPVVNHGTVKVSAEEGAVEFIPEVGFVGLADFNYIACDSVGTCATGAATIYVNEQGATFDDELQLGTGQNTSKSIPMPFKVTSVEPAQNVRIEKSQYAVVYEPEFDFAGTETFTVYGENGNKRTFTIDVIERPVNFLSLAKEDVVYAALGESVSLNLFANDGFSGVSKADILSIQGGTYSGNLENGPITFTPEEGFTGVARIWYRVFDSGYQEHLGQAFVVYDRNNFGPNVRDFEYTFRVNPGQTKIIDYNAPISNYSLSPTDGFDNIAGFISADGNQAVRYEAPEEAPATDQFEISYCVPANSSNCQQIKIRIETVEEQVDVCNNDCVFPGDINNDGIVNSADLLPLGLYVGGKGPSRENASIQFKAQEAIDWGMEFVEETNINLKHYDANGDGVITEADVEAIRTNYGEVRQLVLSLIHI